MNIIDKLRTPIATLIVLCAALLAQLPHAADVFRIIVRADGPLAVAHGYAYAVALELAVLLFVVQRRNVESYVFAVVSVLVNLSYYALHGVALLSIAALPAWLVSIALPAAIARYSHLLVDEPSPPPAEKPLEAPAPGKTICDALQSSVALPVAILGPSSDMPGVEHAGQTDVPATMQEQPNNASVSDARTRALHLRDEGYTAAEIARMIDAKYSTVQSWLRRASVHANGGVQ